jgi:hypothetical protein
LIIHRTPVCAAPPVTAGNGPAAFSGVSAPVRKKNRRDFFARRAAGGKTGAGLENGAQ